MRTAKNAWFWFGGAYSWEKGALMTAWPTRYAPVLNGREKEVSGRDGDVFITDGSYGTVEVTQEFAIRDIAQAPTVHDWLRGAGLLRFSDEPDLAYEARVKSLKAEPAAGRLMGRRYSCRFICQPFRYQYPPAGAITLTSPGSVFNPGTAPALPRITITGTGDFSVTIGGETIWFTDVPGGIVIDSELMDAISPDGTYLMNDHITGMPWKLAPGANAVTWETDTGSSVGSVVILPEWRFL
ncbi:MAG: hypothetical protein IJH78_06640 [Clostridia bacterium]|nr:hypothetical protein [Clostridia bacterium]